jgi:hypothetical protein
MPTAACENEAGGGAAPRAIDCNAIKMPAKRRRRMGLRTKAVLGLAVFLPLIAPPAGAKGTCELQPLMHQRKDAATVEHLEDAWSVAYLQGDTEFEGCLLTPYFMEILRTGEVKTLKDELGFAARNKGKNLAIPQLPKSTVMLHNDVAVAFGISRSAGDGKTQATRYADYYVWENGMWHAFFAQQTPIKDN